MSAGETIDQIVKLLGGEEGMRARLRRRERDEAFKNAHLDELIDAYPDQWAAIYEEEVVAVQPTAAAAVKAVEEEGYPPGEIVLVFLDSTRPLVMLAMG